MAILFISVILSVRLGSADLEWQEFWNGIMKEQGYERVSFVLWSLRLPRTLAAVLAGVGLSIAGVALQNITGNDLAGPNIIGVNAGAGFFVMMGMYFLPAEIKILPFLAFLGAFSATVTILLIGNTFHSGKNTLILAGVAVTAILNAGISLISRLDTDLVSVYNEFAVGGLNGTGLNELIVPSIFIFGSFIVLFCFSKDMDTLMLGEGISKSLGVNVKLVKWSVILAGSAAAGMVVSFAGLLGFVGLIVPHMARKIFGVKTKETLFFSAVLGAIVVLIADTLGRSLFPGTEIPVGIVMAFLGVPFFMYLIVRRNAA